MFYLAPLLDLKANLLAIIQRSQARLLDGADVDEDILAAILRLMKP